MNSFKTQFGVANIDNTKFYQDIFEGFVVVRNLDEVLQKSHIKKDYSLFTDSGKEFSLEEKVIKRKTECYLFELDNVYQTKTSRGWFYRDYCDLLSFFDLEEKVCRIYHYKKLYDFIMSQGWPTKIVEDKNYGKVVKTSKLLIVSKKDCEKYKIYEKYI